MKRWILLLLTIFYGCGVAIEDQVRVTPEAPVLVEREEEKSLYPNLESYVSAVEFQDGKKIKGDPYQRIFYESVDGIESLNLGEFYDKFQQDESALEARRVELLSARYIENLEVQKIQELSDKAYAFLEEKNKGVLKDSVEQAKANKAMLKKLNKKYKSNPEKISLEHLEQLIILAEENGEYARVEELYKHKCTLYPDSCGETTLSVSGWVKDDTLAQVPDVKIHVLNYPSLKPFTSDAEADYEFVVKVRPHQLIRIRYSAAGYMPQVKEYRIGPMGNDYKLYHDVRMPRAKETKIIESESYKNLKTELGDLYKIRAGILKDGANNDYTNDVQAYFYSFNPQQDDMGEVLEGSIRIEGGVVPASNLISFGMAYAEFFTMDGERLSISKDNPLYLQTRVANASVFYNTYKQQGESEDDFWNYWIEYSEKHGAFTATELDRPFSGYWVYNLQTGIWDEVPLKVLDKGLLESVFYTQN